MRCFFLFVCFIFMHGVVEWIHLSHCPNIATCFAACYGRGATKLFYAMGDTKLKSSILCILIMALTVTPCNKKHWSFITSLIIAVGWNVLSLWHSISACGCCSSLPCVPWIPILRTYQVGSAPVLDLVKWSWKAVESVPRKNRGPHFLNEHSMSHRLSSECCKAQILGISLELWISLCILYITILNAAQKRGKMFTLGRLNLQCPS